MLEQIPLLPRLSDWLGVWAMELSHAQTLLAAIGDIDWPAHLRAFDESKQAREPVAASEFETVTTKGKNLAVVSITGTMLKSRASMGGGTSTVAVRRQVRAAARDEDVSGILLRIDSPGGTVAGTDLLAREVSEARKSKPVLAQIEDVGASAAYWVASQAGRVYASTQTALVGSIGTLLTVDKRADGLAVFRSGPHKGAGLDGEITDQQAAHLQALVDGLQAQFSEAVARGRRLTSEQVAEVATGATWLAGQAMALRLIDGVQSVEQTLDLLASMR